MNHLGQRMPASYLENISNFISVSPQYPSEHRHQKLHVVFVHICSNDLLFPNFTEFMFYLRIL